MDVYARLSGGDRRSIGDVAAVIEQVRKDPALFGVVFEGMGLDDPLLRMRCADAVEKITQTHPELLRPYASRLLDDVAGSGQQEVRWHVALMLPRLPLTPAQRRRAVAVLLGYLGDGSRIVRANALEGLTGLAESDASLREQVTEELVRAADSDSAAVRVRARNMRRRLRG